MKTADLIKILLSPRVTEKAAMGGSTTKAQYVFDVDPKATKATIAAAVEAGFGVKVDCVRVANYKGKTARFGKVTGRHKHWKKAYVCLQPNYQIDIVASQG